MVNDLSNTSDSASEDACWHEKTVHGHCADEAGKEENGYSNDNVQDRMAAGAQKVVDVEL